MFELFMKLDEWVERYMYLSLSAWCMFEIDISTTSQRYTVTTVAI